MLQCLPKLKRSCVFGSMCQRVDPEVDLKLAIAGCEIHGRAKVSAETIWSKSILQLRIYSCRPSCAFVF